MSDYSYSEIQSMQQRAMERVREMNRSSESALKMAQSELEPEVRRQEKKPPQNPAPIKTKHTVMPPNFPKPQEKRQEKKEAHEVHEGGLLDSIMKEPDRALLMGLLMLLKSEGADEALMLALTYIMA